MILNIRQHGELRIMQASGKPEEIALFIEAAGLVEVPVIICESEDGAEVVEMAQDGLQPSASHAATQRNARVAQMLRERNPHAIAG